MASSSAGAVRTPLESVFSYIPPTHEKGVKQALFNVAALGGVITVGATGLATYAVFQPFVKPLLWALLLGTVIHPVKRRLTAAARRWLADLERSGSPLFLHALLAPLRAFDAATDAIGDAAVRHIRALLAFVVGIALVNVVWFYTPSVLMALVWLVSHGVIGNLLWLLTSIFYNKLLCWTLLAGYVVAVAFFWSPATRRFAVPCWLLLLGFLSGLAGSLAGPIFVALVALLAVGFVTEVLARRREQQDEGINVSMSKTIVAIMYDEYVSHEQSSATPVPGESEPQPTEPAGLLSPGADESPSSLPSSIAQSPADSAASPPGAETTPATSTRAAAYLAQKGMTSTPLSRVRPRTLQAQQAAAEEGAEDPAPGAGGSSVQIVSGPDESATVQPQPPPQSGDRPSSARAAASSGHSQTTTYITAVAYCCLVVVVWQRIWLISMLPVVIVYYFIKRIVINFWQSGGRDSAVAALQPAFAWLRERREGIMPLPVRGVWKLILRGNVHIIAGVQGSVDSVVTVLVVLGALVFVTFAAVFAAVQIYGETVHMIEMAGNVFNRTVLANPDLQAMMPANMSSMVEQMIDNGYIYGRDYISKLVRDLTKGAGAQSQAQLERETLELWTRLYQAWVSSVVAAPAVGPVVDSAGIASAWNVWLEKVQSYPDLLTVEAVKAAVQDNLDTVLSVLDSSWTILRGNVTMLLSVVTQLVSVLLGGGFAVLNSLINMIVFVTALFYLLSSSGHLYKPVELIAKLGPVSRGSSRFVMAVDEAVSSVFVASFKMAVFYLLWTWLVHSVFAVKFVYLPSVVAAVLGAVPFLGSYWAALPAVLELWLVHAQPLVALLFFAAQLAPILFVDTAIYSEVKGGHPYLTGLAIAGGIFWLGIEGAIFGPVLLCCLLVAVNVYTSLVNTPDQESKMFGGRLKSGSPYGYQGYWTSD